MPLLEGRASSPHEYFFYVYPERLDGVRDATWKLRITREGDGEIVSELFNLAVDPYERFNVADDHADVVSRLKARMEAFAEETDARLVWR